MVGFAIINRNIRLFDNNVINKALAENDQVAVIFIGTPEQLDPSKNAYHNSNSIQFMVESLEDLDSQLTNIRAGLNIFYGDYSQIIEQLLKLYPNSKVYLAHDFTPYAKRREEAIKKITTSLSVPLTIIMDEYTIFDVNTIKTTSTNTPYKTFKGFYEKVYDRLNEIKIIEPDFSQDAEKFVKLNLSSVDTIKTYTVNDLKQFYQENDNLLIKGGRRNLPIILNNVGTFVNYGQTRDTPAINTTLLSAYIKFGCLSMREAVRWSLGVNSELTRQIIWHDFFANIMEHLSEMQSVGGGNFKDKTITWQYNDPQLQVWKTGRTGFPLADAGMRQLNTVGWMHNRVRMLVVGILCHLFRLNWRDGEKYFAQKLVDYDVPSNNGNWQATAGVGYDYRWRIFNPFNQSKEHDKNCEYIKKWVPELASVPNKAIHNWENEYSNYSGTGYPGPLVNYSTSRQLAEQLLR